MNGSYVAKQTLQIEACYEIFSKRNRQRFVSDFWLICDPFSLASHLLILFGPFYIGRVPKTSTKAALTSTAAQSRLNRRNNAKQGQTKKRQALVSATRLFNGVDGTPRIVAVIPLSEDVDARSTVAALAEALDAAADDCPETGLWKLKSVVVNF